MTARATWTAGTNPGLTWTTTGATATNFNSLAAGSSISSAQIDNSSNLDLYLDVSISVKPGATTTASSYFSLFLLPLNQDGSTYGDSSIGANTTAAAIPAPQYQVGSLSFGAAVTSSNPCTGTVGLIVMPPGKFVLVLANNLGNALNASAAGAWLYRTYGENLNG